MLLSCYNNEMELGKIVYKGKTKKGRDMLIRYPKKSDTPILLDYMNTLSKERTFIHFQGEQLKLKEEEKYMNDFLKKIKKNQGVKLLAFIGDKLVGVSDTYLQEKTEKHVGVFGITVAKEYRGEGIGRLLMNLVIEEAKKYIKELKIVRLGCFANNKTACVMYKNSGFKEYGRLPAGIRHRGEFVDHVYFYKNI